MHQEITPRVLQMHFELTLLRSYSPRASKYLRLAAFWPVESDEVPLGVIRDHFLCFLELYHTYTTTPFLLLMPMLQDSSAPLFLWLILFQWILEKTTGDDLLEHSGSLIGAAAQRSSTAVIEISDVFQKLLLENCPENKIFALLDIFVHVIEQGNLARSLQDHLSPKLLPLIIVSELYAQKQHGSVQVEDLLSRFRDSISHCFFGKLAKDWVQEIFSCLFDMHSIVDSSCLKDAILLYDGNSLEVCSELLDLLEVGSETNAIQKWVDCSVDEPNRRNFEHLCVLGNLISVCQEKLFDLPDSFYVFF